MAEFDYVIIGAGSAGCVLANRLSEDPNTTVALLEAGGPDNKMEIHTPVAFSKLFKTGYDWNFSTSKQTAMLDRELYWPRGKTLGGSSSLNAQMWVRGHRADYDGWDLPGWAFDDVLPYFRKAEHRDGSNLGGVYGLDGPIWISELRDPNPTTKAFLEACAEMGMDRLGELNEPDNEGYSPTPVTQRRGRRCSTADAYLKPARRRKNLSVLTEALARRVLISEDGEPRATGVEYTDKAGGVQQVMARKEVIVSAGAVGSPHLLMLSGIGDPAELTGAGVTVRHELPGVGANLQDHLATGIILHCPEPITLVGAEKVGHLARYLLFRRGMLTSNVGEAVAFLRSSPEEPAPDLELIWAPGPFIDHGQTPPPGHGVTVGVILLCPDSRGRIGLTSADPADPPVIDAGYLTAERDLNRLVHGLKVAKKLLATGALKPYAGEPMKPWEGEETDEELARFVRERGETLYHPVGTCRMGADERSVVDPELRVRGIGGLRVVDASVMPTLNRGHTHAPTVMIAERGADLIKEATKE